MCMYDDPNFEKGKIYNTFQGRQIQVGRPRSCFSTISHVLVLKLPSSWVFVMIMLQYSCISYTYFLIHQISHSRNTPKYLCTQRKNV